MGLPWDEFNVTYVGDFDWGDFDVDWFCKIENRDVAYARLDFLSTPGNIYKLMEFGYGEPLARMWKAVLRASIGFGIPLTGTQVHLASEYGIVIPE